MNIVNRIIVIMGIGLLSACGADTETSISQVGNVTEIGSFNLEIEGVVKFDQNAKKAKSFNYESDYWEFSANGAKLRMAGRFPDDITGVEQTSIDLEFNNLYLEFYYMVGKKRTRVSCKAAQEPNGQIKRTIHEDLSNSGSFSIEMVLCRNTYTSEKIAEIATPIIIKGTFKNSPHSETLF